MKIDHICFAVKNIEEGVAYWERVFGYRQMTGVVENTRQKVKVSFLSKEDSITVKLIEPAEGNQSLQNFVNKGGGFHHTCFRCDDLNTKIDELKKEGLIMLVPPQPGEAFNNHDIAFLFARNGMNIELIDTDEKADRLF
jgi:methylmalonyl-CoA/ethylmalonyl-CoA epimerase